MKEIYDTNGLIPLTSLESKDFEKTIIQLNDFWKAKSIAYLDKFGLPTLSAIAITTWNDKIKENLLNYCKNKNWSSVVIRTDKAKETGEKIPRGGYLTNLDNLENEIKKNLENGRIAIVLEPRDRYKNLYGINILYDNNAPENLYFEIVGPGFEVGNLNRGDIKPHERFILKKTGEEIKIQNHEIIPQSEYENSVEIRFAQIGKSISEKKLANSEFIKIGRDFLLKNEYSILEDNRRNYQNIPLEYVKKIKNYVATLSYKLSKNSLDLDQFVLSATVFDSGELVFWDIVWPEHKYEGLKSG